ncbi:MAG: hypothetical protein IT378_25365 [Sandaracinaceae bacterium]|nr:hypothetical protein [Sandaracinaceae bacterium]
MRPLASAWLWPTILLAVGALGACTASLGGGRDGGSGSGADASSIDAGQSVPIDAANGSDASGDAGTAPATDAYVPPPPPVDAGPTCTPTQPDCNGCCGPVPNGCGVALPCEPCGEDVWCAPGTSMHTAQVRASVEAVMAAHPEYFDPVMFRDTSSWLVTDDAAYTAAVLAECNSRGLVCIVDPNDDHELRVRAPGSRLAENHGIRTHGMNRTWYRYQGVCETDLF